MATLTSGEVPGKAEKGINIREARVSTSLSILLVVLLLVLVGLGVLILRTIFMQEQPKTPQDYEIQKWQATIKANPKDPNAHTSLGWVYQLGGKLKEAEQEYLTALKIDPNNIGALYNLGLIYVAKNKTGEAINRFEQIVEKDPSHALAWYQLGALRMGQKNYKEAIVCFQNALQAEPSYANIHYELGTAYEKLGEKDKAKQEYEITLQFLPNHRDAKQALERIK